jgi:neutral ceramidase
MGAIKKHQELNDQAGVPTIPAEVQGIKIGDCVLITSPAELLVEIGLNLKKASPYECTLVAPFSNGYMHYGAPADAYSRGGYGSDGVSAGPGMAADL